MSNDNLQSTIQELQTRLAASEAERIRLSENLARFEADLRALQNTRTVRATRLAGQLVAQAKTRLHGQPFVQPEPITPPTSAEPAPTHVQAETVPLANYDSWFWERYSLDATHNAQVWDFDQADLGRNRATLVAHPGPLDLQNLVWLLPPFQHAYYGGVHTILRFAAYFRERHGVSSRFVIVRPPEQGFDLPALQRSVAEAFPALAEAEISTVNDYADLERLEPADGVVATYWTTAYYALRFNRVRRKFYFIQDYEPLFYPAGTSYALAEATYQFGFYGLTNTIALRQIYTEQYGGLAEFFTPAVDTTIFHANGRLENSERPRLFFYGRPGQPRNAFELGTAALRKLKARLGDRVEIVTAGANWSPRQYGLEGVVENLGLLPYAATAELYRSCQAGLILMFTRHPSYLPFELMASGALVVTNPNPATRWLLQDRQNCLLATPSASHLAETLELALTDSALRSRLTTSALNLIQRDHADWPSQAEKIYRFMIS